MKYRTGRNASTNPTGTGAFVHDHITTAPEPEHRPPPASMLASWVIGTVESEQIGGDTITSEGRTRGTTRVDSLSAGLPLGSRRRQR